MLSDDDKWIQSGDDADFGGIVEAAEIEREAVLLEALDGCSKSSAVQGLRWEGGVENLGPHDGVIGLGK